MECVCVCVVTLMWDLSFEELYLVRFVRYVTWSQSPCAAKGFSGLTSVPATWGRRGGGCIYSEGTGN